MKTKHSFIKIVSRSIVFFIVLHIPAKLHTQSARIRFEHFTVDDGLSQNAVECILQDRDGYLWFGTQDGLNMYDGYNFKVFRHDPADSTSLCANIIHSIYEDKSGALWIGTPGGLCLLSYEQKHQGIFLRPKPADFLDFDGDSGEPQIIVIESVQKRTQDRQKKRYQDRKYALNDIEWLYKDGVGIFWVGAQIDGNMMNIPVNIDSSQLAVYNHNTDKKGKLSHEGVWSIYTSNHGQGKYFWLVTSGRGLCRIDSEKRIAENFIHYKHVYSNPNSLLYDEVRSLLVDEHDNLWIGTGGRGLSNLVFDDNGNETFIHYQHDPADPFSLGSNSILSLYQDRDGIIWVGTGGGGLNKFDPQKLTFSHYKKNPADPNSLLDNSVWCFYEDKMGNLWVGTRKGLTVLPKENRKAAVFKHYGIDRVTPKNLRPRQVRAIHEDRNGILWIGTLGGGLTAFDREQASFTFYQHAAVDSNSIISNNIYAITEDHAGSLWIGTNDGGLTRLRRSVDGKAQFTNYIYRTDFSRRNNNWVITILKPADSTSHLLWLGTWGFGLLAFKGLSKFDPRSEVFRNYDTRDGLQSNEFNLGAYYKGENGELFFGGPNGFNSFVPAEDINPHPPEIVLTGFRKFGNPVEFAKALSQMAHLELAHDEDFFGFEFVALHFKNPAKNQYAYKMEGFDKDWVQIGAKREASYTNLDPGEYTFRVKAANSDGVWNEEGTSIKITIEPPFWQEWWFLAMIGALLALLIYTFYKIRIYAVLQIERATQRALVEDFHDELGQDLSKIAMLAGALKREARRLPGAVIDKLDRIMAYTDSVTTDMQVFLREHDPDENSLFHLAMHLKDISDRLFDHTDIAFQLEGLTDEMEKIRLPVIWRQQLIRPFQEAMTNILKHAKGCCGVALEFIVHGNLVEITLRDDGCGFAIDTSRKGHGLKNMRKRAEKLHGKLEVFSDAKKGCRVTFTGKLP